MKNLKAKLKKQGGFTLIEMLIVVAIIAILIAISIPLINSSLEKARDATDDANFRNAMSLGEILWLTTDTPITAKTEYYYVIDGTSKVGGTLKPKASATGMYESKCTETAGTHTATGTKSGCYILVTIDPTVSATNPEGVVTATWSPKS